MGMSSRLRNLKEENASFLMDNVDNGIPCLQLLLYPEYSTATGLRKLEAQALKYT